MVQVKDTEFDGVPVRIYSPKGKPANSPGFVYYHGGGWVIGSLGELCSGENGLLIKPTILKPTALKPFLFSYQPYAFSQ